MMPKMGGRGRAMGNQGDACRPYIKGRKLGLTAEYLSIMISIAHKVRPVVPQRELNHVLERRLFREESLNIRQKIVPTPHQQRIQSSVYNRGTVIQKCRILQDAHNCFSCLGSLIALTARSKKHGLRSKKNLPGPVRRTVKEVSLLRAHRKVHKDRHDAVDARRRGCG